MCVNDLYFSNDPDLAKRIGIRFVATVQFKQAPMLNVRAVVFMLSLSVKPGVKCGAVSSIAKLLEHVNVY